MKVSKKIKSGFEDMISNIFKNDKFFLVVILLFVLSSISIYMALGMADDAFPGSESNYNMRVARQISESGWDLEILRQDNVDDYSSFTSSLHINLHTLFLSLVYGLPAYVLKILNVFISAVLIFLLHLFMRQNRFNPILRNTTLLILAFTPTIIYNSLVLSALPSFVILCLLSLIMLKKRMFLVTLISLLVPLYGIFYSVVYIFILLVYSFSTEMTKNIHYPASMMIFSSITLQSFGFNPSVFPITMESLYMTSVELITEFGGLRSIGVMGLTVALIGLFKSFINREQPALQLATLILLISSIAIDFKLIFIVIMILCGYAANGIKMLLDRKWFSYDLKRLTILIIACGILFTQLTYIPTAVSLEPRPEKANALDWMSRRLEPGIVLTSTDYSVYVQNIAGMTTLSNYFERNAAVEILINDIFKSRDLGRTRRQLIEYGIDYIYIDDDIRSSVWLHDRDGLLFLLDNEDNFRLLFDGEGGVKIYEFIGDPDLEILRP